MKNSLPKKNWNEYENLIHSIGKNDVSLESDCDFLIPLNLVENGQLTSIGKEYFMRKHCYSDEESARELIKERLLELPYIQLIVESFWGKPKIRKTNVANLLKIHDYEFPDRSLTNLISILNRFKILTYSKKSGVLVINVKPSKTKLPDRYYVHSDKPFSNQRIYSQIFDCSEGFFFWVEKHFSKKMYELIVDNVDGNRIHTVRLLTGYMGIKDADLKSYKKLKIELQSKNVKFEHRIICDSEILNSIHDRWIHSKNSTYNVPPLNSVLMGQASEIHKTVPDENMERWWNSSLELEKSWNKITNEINIKESKKIKTHA